MTVTAANGQPAANVAVGATLTASTKAPIEHVGQTSQQVETTWNPQQARLSGDGIVHPDGWSLEYTTDGTTWSDDEPADLSTVRGVRSAGDVESNGLAGGSQVSTSHGSGTLKTGAASFQGSSGGDGWDVFFTDDKVLNVWHHNSQSYNLDCHYRATGESCDSQVYSVSGHQSSGASSGAHANGKIYSTVIQTSTNTMGTLCTNVASVPFTSCGYTPLISGASYYAQIGSQSFSDGKVFTPTAVGGGNLLCYDTATSAACPDQPYAMSGLQGIGSVQAFSMAVSGKVFVTANKIWCFNAAALTACSGSWPASYGSASNPDPDDPFGGGGGAHSVIPMRNSAKVLTGVCMIYPSLLCYDLTGAAATVPAGLTAAFDAQAFGGGFGGSYAQYGFTDRRQYWVSNGANWNATVACFDWATGAACAGFSFAGELNNDRYALVPDPNDPACVWSNGDSGEITAFNGLTGAAGCTPADPIVTYNYSTIVPRLACDEEGRVRSWEDLTLSGPDGVDLQTLKVTVLDSVGEAVAGFTDLTPNEAGSVDLSELSLTSTGTQPAIQVTMPGVSDGNAAAVTAAVRYVSDAPELCVDLVVLQDCPELEPGVSETATVPVGAIEIRGKVNATVDNDEITTPLAADVTRAPMGDCLGAVSGKAERTYGEGASAPIVGGTINLLDDEGNVLDTTTSGSDGGYTFTNVHPGSYAVAIGSISETAEVEATETDTVDLAVPVADPTASPVTGTTLQNTATTIAISAESDPFTEIDLSSVQLWDANAEEWTTTLHTAEGVWSVTDDGELHFDPELTFHGETAPVTYRVADKFGNHAQSTATVTVLASLPTALPVAEHGVQGDKVTLLPNGVSQTVPLVDESLRLVNDEGLPVSELIIDGVGTYEVDVDAGKIVFTPVSDFIGTSTVVYRIVDEADRTATSTMTVTLSPLQAKTNSPVVGYFSPGTINVTGVPAGSTVTVPSSVAHTRLVTVNGTSFTVYPAAGFSGVMQVPYTVVHGSAHVDGVALVTVRPASVPYGSRTLSYWGTTVVRWLPAGGASQYAVRVGGVVRCVTAETGCDVKGLLGPHSRIDIISIGGGKVISPAVPIAYRNGVCVPLGSVYFDPTSSTLTAATQAALSRLAYSIAVQGFPEGCLIGHTDSMGSAEANRALSARRVAAVAGYFAPRIPKVALTRSYVGETAPTGPNDTPAGRAANRRVEIRVG